MVESNIMDVTANPTTPMVVIWAEAFKKLTKYWLISCPMSGTKFFKINS